MRSITISPFLAFALALSTRAQDLELPSVLGADDPVRTVVRATYDVAADRLSSARSDPLQALGSSCFASTDTFDAFVVANLGEDLVSWGVKSCPRSKLLRSVTIAYRTTAVDPSHGGPGATLSFGLYRDARGFGRLGTEVFRRTVTGMPGKPIPGPGASALVLLTFDFGDHPLLLRDGAIGWSVMQLDGMTGPILVRAPRVELGTSDALDIFSPGPATLGNYIGTFNFGGCGPPWFGPCASLYFELDEIPLSEIAGSTSVNGTGVNPAILAEILPARLGQAWIAEFDLSGHPGTSATFVLASRAAFGPLAIPAGEVLIDPAQLIRPLLTGAGFHVVPIPDDPALAGLVVHTQGLIQTPAGMQLTNGLDLTVGY